MCVMAILILIVFYETLVDEQASITEIFKAEIFLTLLFAIGMLIFRISRRKSIENGNDGNTENKSKTSIFFIYFLRIGGASIIMFFNGWYIMVGINLMVDSHFDNTGLLPIIAIMFIPALLVGLGLYLVGKHVEAHY